MRGARRCHLVIEGGNKLVVPQPMELVWSNVLNVSKIQLTGELCKLQVLNRQRSVRQNRFVCRPLPPPSCFSR